MATAASSPTATPNNNPSSSRAERDRLRDYYGLASSSSSSSTATTPAARQTPLPVAVEDPAQRYKELVRRQNISGLLKAQSDLLTEIRELDGDRQSLVYNHHTDLISASETIRKMKSHAEALSPTLSTLTASFESMSRLEAQFRSAIIPINPPPAAQLQSHPSQLDVQADLAPIVTLPRRLRDLIALEEDNGNGAGLAQAEALWGRHESILSAWMADGVPGADAVAAECRAVLKEERENARRRRGSVSASSRR